MNFIKFSRWPQGSEKADDPDLRLCVVGLTPVAKAFQDSEGKTVVGRPLRVDLVRLPGNVDDCHLLYLSDWDLESKGYLLESIHRRPILTVSDVAGFARAGGMIELVVVGRRLRFEINLDAVRGAGFRLDPKLLALAVRIHGNAQQGP